MSRCAAPLRVALAGCGAVGGALLDRFLEEGTLVGRRLEVVRVLVRDGQRRRRAGLSPAAWTTSLDDFLRSPADLVVEVIGGTGTAARIAEHVLGRGGRLVTANKALMAAHGMELTNLARRSGGWLGFEAAVGGAVPVVRILRHALAGQSVHSFRGILNGTANHVLSRLEEGATLPDAIDAARRLGLAEADPSRDLDGRDVADKLAILAWLAWGVDPRSVRVARAGLPPDAAAQAQAAAARGERLRLIGECRLGAGGVTARVRPEVVPAASALGQTVEAQNRIEFELGWGTPLVLSGPGAGGIPTAGAVWGDLVDAAEAA